ncbi:hypothetical protein IX38_20395 [Chryseobacterium luteum]|uniref:Uncharacterized protein n=1 Tax=Chryseobacterium luteum TaxID=421531 RepID=A0A085YZL5_9FLAO|nr:hypothetical protein IX38_20395 [Chryseobacterium luteum]
MLSNVDKDDAIKFYYDHVMKIEHWHIVAFTRSFEILNSYKNELEKCGVRTIQNDIPHYKTKDDVF